MTQNPQQNPREITAEDVEIRSIDFMYHDLIPVGEVGGIAGTPGKGKSTLACEIMAYVTRDLGRHVICSLMEDAPGITRARLEAAGADLSKVIIPTIPLKFPESLERFELLCLKHDPALAVFDPAPSHLTPKLTDESGLRSALDPLASLAQQYGCTVLFIAHPLKNPSTRADPMLAFPGHLVKPMRWAALFGPNPAEPSERILCPIKNSYGPQQDAVLYEMEQFDIFDEDTEEHKATVGKLIVTNEAVPGVDPISLLVNRASDGSGGGARAEKLALAAEWLTETLREGAVYAKDLRNDAAAAGLSWATIRRAFDEICAETVPMGAKELRRNFWQLPEKHPERVTNPNYVDAYDAYPELLATTGQPAAAAKIAAERAAEAAAAANTGVQTTADEDDSDDDDGDIDGAIAKILGGN